ncbi:MAG TPA: hypothetical protein VFP47_19140, partial [Pyrinomonadaceae bacterium]|nr:hypothetical protein [Pyrinomonadaceae bacterium]
VASVFYLIDQLHGALLFVVFVVADGFRRDAVVLEQLVCVARVFTRDQVDVFQDLKCAMRDVCKVADRRRY